MKNHRKVLWSKKAINSLKDHHDRIAVNSKTAAKRVKAEILRASKEIPPYAEKYQVDEYYPNNPGNIRRFFRWSYRIVYQVSETSIDILNVIHTSQEPNSE